MVVVYSNRTNFDRIAEVCSYKRVITTPNGRYFERFSFASIRLASDVKHKIRSIKNRSKVLKSEVKVAYDIQLKKFSEVSKLL